MAVSLDAATASGVGTGSTSITFAHTNNGTTLMVAGANETSLSDGTTYNGSAMTLVGTLYTVGTSGTGVAFGIWKHLSPAAGSNNVVVNGGNDNFLACAVSAGDIRSNSSDSGNSTTPATTPASTNADDLVIDFLNNYTADPSVGANQTELTNVLHTTGGWYLSSSWQDGADGAAMTWSMSSNTWRISAVSIQGPATAAVTGTATASITEADVVAGGKTIITTLTGDTFIADTVPGAAFSSGTPIGTTTAGGRAGDGTIAVTFPATPTVGQFGIIICYLDAGTASITAGWSLVTGAPWGSATPKLYIWTRVMLTGDTVPTITISGAGASDSSVENTAFYDGIGSVVTIGAATTGTGTPSTAAQITGAAVGNIIVGIIGRGDNEAMSGQTFGGSSTGVNERLDGGTGSGNDSQISLADKTLTATGATGALSVTTAATDPYIGIILELGVATNSPYKVAAVNLWAPLLDSAQAEANGWDARVKPALAASHFVRTSATVTTITLPAVGTYDITAQETITDTVPGGILTAGTQIVATPTFTVSTGSALTPVDLVRAEYPSAYLRQTAVIAY
jgi:hypothetical protein